MEVHPVARLTKRYSTLTSKSAPAPRIYLPGLVKRVIVTPAVYPRLVEFLHFDIQSTGQKSHCVNIL